MPGSCRAFLGVSQTRSNSLTVLRGDGNPHHCRVAVRPLMQRVLVFVTLITAFDPPPSARLSDQERRIGRVDISALLLDQAIGRIQEALDGGHHLKLAFANAHVVNLAAGDDLFARALQCFLVLPDGIGVDIAARLLHREAFPANLNGSDFMPALLLGIKRPLRVGLVGARPGVAERAAAKLGVIAPGHSYRVFSHGFFGEAEEAALLAALMAERPDVLLVAFGNPRQEMWIANRLDRRHCGMAAGVGALFDFLGGEVKRAPAFARHLRIEWMWRLALEPLRLWRRYIVGNPLFLLRVMAQKLGGR